jgi:hypothetical protein
MKKKTITKKTKSLTRKQKVILFITTKSKEIRMAILQFFLSTTERFKFFLESIIKHLRPKKTQLQPIV